MFSKNTEKLESIVGTNSHFEGNIRSKGTLRIDGSVNGNIEADWLILGEKATLRGDVTARGVIVGGKVEGNVHAKEILEIKAKGQVVGDLTTSKLSVSEGGMLEGRTTMQREDSKIIEFHLKENRSGEI
ncbi:MAG: polymer-forming cytoskeletal protein [Nitrospirota bacterium]|jgi:cytoskeletal protein CcmA (bactofilin family)